MVLAGEYGSHLFAGKRSAAIDGHQKKSAFGRAIAKLALIIVAPRGDASVGANCEAMIRTGRHRDDLFSSERTDRSHEDRHPARLLVTGAKLAVIVISPGGDRYRLAGYVSVEEGDIRGMLIDVDAEGWSVGLLGEMTLDQAGASRLLGGLSYGGFSFDGSRGGATATASGWAPGSARFRDVEAGAFDAFIGLDAILYQTDRFRLIPAIGVRYSRGSTDSFAERSGAIPGLPIALAVDRVKHETFIAEFALTAEADLTARLTLRAGIGFHAGLKDDSPEITARFATGSRPMTVQALNLSEDLLFIHVGAAWKASDSISVGIGYRAEIRSETEALNQVSFGTSFAF